MTVLICINGISIGVQADNSPESLIWVHMEVFFVSVFALEITAKLIAYKGLFWIDAWNIVDFAIVAVSVVELVLLLVTLTP